MANYKDILTGTLSTLAGKAKEIAASDTVTGLVGKAKEAVDASSVRNVYAQGAGRAKAYGRIAKLTLENNGEHEELGRVYTEIGRLYYEQAKDAPEGFFAPLFAQAGEITQRILEKEAEIAALKQELEDAKAAGDIDVEIAEYEQMDDLDADITAFDQIVDATGDAGSGADTPDDPQ